MLSPGALPSNAPSASDPKQGSSLRVYLRLVGYAWRYKGRLLVSVFFALVIAASFGAMLVSVGTVIDVTFYTPALDEDGALKRPDPADKIVNYVSTAETWSQDTLRWSPAWLSPERAVETVAGIRAEPVRFLAFVCGTVIVLWFLIGIATYIQEYFAGAIGARITTDLGEEMYANLMRQSVGFFEARSSGEILARFTNDIFMVNRGLSGVFVKLMREPVKALTFLLVALNKDAMLTLLGVCVLPPVAYVLIRIGKKMRRSVRRSLEKVASMASVVNETVSGIAIVKGYTMEDYEVRRVRVEILNLRRFLYQMARLSAATSPLTEFILVLGISAFVLFSAHRVSSGQLDPGSLITLFGALAMMLDPVRKLSTVNNLVQTSVASAERVFEFVDMEPDIVEAPAARVIAPLAETLRFENVSFAYDGKTEVLRGIDIEIKKGEMVALVGFSGAGKSTLVKLIPRFYDVSGGAVRIDGTDIREATFESLRNQIGIVTQDTILFAESIRDNITYGKADYTPERVQEAARAANAAEFVEKLPGAYDSMLGEGGCSLSGGQRQRLAIARAIIKDPAILILDEATSSLDSESERLIQEALDKFVTGRTTIVIAHRLSTVQRADRIVVMDQGQIVEQGTHAQLFEAGGIYRRLHDTQFGRAKE